MRYLRGTGGWRRTDNLPVCYCSRIRGWRAKGWKGSDNIPVCYYWRIRDVRGTGSWRRTDNLPVATAEK
jgi:hypothetical protein